MNTDNKTTRELAIGWFNSKASLEKTRLCDTNTEIVGTVRRWETLTGREIETIYLSEHTTETESKKEEHKEGYILAHENYPFGSTAEIGSRDRSLYEHKKESFIAGFNTLSKENKELKEVLADIIMVLAPLKYNPVHETLMNKAKQALNQ